MNVTQDMPCAIDLFCGAGGISLGFKQAGFNVCLGVDTDKSALATFKRNIGSETANLDIDKCSGQEILERAGQESLDVVIGCPPCQGYSGLGRSKGSEADPRNRLVESFGQLITEIMPTFLTFENVPGVAIEGSYFSKMIEMIESCGYNHLTRLVDMREFGVPQNRSRIVVVGCCDKSVWKRFHFPVPTHSKEGLEGMESFSTVREAIGHYPPLNAGEKSSRINNHESMDHSERILDRIRQIPLNGGSLSDAASEHQYACHKNSNVGFKDVFGRMNWDKPSPTITTGCGNPSRGRFLHPEQDRGISLREAAALQTFPDDFLFEGNKSEIMRQIGNAFPPRFSRILAESIYLALRPDEGSLKSSNCST